MLKQESFRPQKVFREILEEVERSEECIVETSGSVFTLSPEAVARLKELSSILSTLSVSEMLKARDPSCDECIKQRREMIFSCVQALRNGNGIKAREVLADIPHRNLPYCETCVAEAKQILEPLQSASALAQVSHEDFTRTPVVTSFSKINLKDYVVIKEYDVPLPEGFSYRVRILKAPTGYYYDPILPTETLSIKERLILTKATSEIGDSDLPPEKIIANLKIDKEHFIVRSILDMYIIKGLGDVQFLLYDRNITDIFIYPSGVVEVSTKNMDLQCTLRMTSKGLKAFANNYRRVLGLPFDMAEPMTSVFWNKHNVRISAIGYTANYSGKPDIAIRLWPEKPWNILHFVQEKSLTFEIAAILTVAMNFGVGAIIGGGIGAGKSTLLQTVFFMVPRYTRKVALLTAREIHRWFFERRFRISELKVHTENEVSQKGVPITQAVKQVLIHGESGYVILNEVKYREEAAPFFTAAAASGRSSVLTTMHANSADKIVQRMYTDFELPLQALRVVKWIPVMRVVKNPMSIFKRRVLSELTEVGFFKKDPIAEDALKQLIRYDPKRRGWIFAGVAGELSDEELPDFIKESEFLSSKGEEAGLVAEDVAELVLVYRDAYKEIYERYGGAPDADTFLRLIEKLHLAFPEEGFKPGDRDEILKRWRSWAMKKI